MLDDVASDAMGWRVLYIDRTILRGMGYFAIVNHRLLFECVYVCGFLEHQCAEHTTRKKRFSLLISSQMLPEKLLMAQQGAIPEQSFASRFVCFHICMESGEILLITNTNTLYSILYESSFEAVWSLSSESSLSLASS